MSIPQVLMSGVKNENQDLQITTDVLEPNVLNGVQAVFVIPKKASVLDSKSALKIRLNWSGYTTNGTTDVGGKLFSGVLGLIKNARLYASGQLISELRSAGEKIHLDNQFKAQEYKEEYCDVKHGSSSGFLIAEGDAQSGASGSIMNADEFSYYNAGADATTLPTFHGQPYFRGLGGVANSSAVVGNEGDDGLEMFLLIEELFPMLKDIQLPVRFMKDEIRIEIDWEQDKSRYLYQSGGAVNLGQVSITDSVLFLDYITYSPEVDSALEQSIMNTGVQIPFRQTAIITKQLAGQTGATAVEVSDDVLLGMEGRAVMKIYIAKKYANTWGNALTGGANSADLLQGDCRSERLKGEKFNAIINDLLIYDRDVENNHEAYCYLSYAGEAPYVAYPDSWEYNDNYSVSAPTTDVLFTTNDANNADQMVLNRAGATTGVIKDGIKGTQNWCAIDCSKYGAQLNPMNAMRIGATPIIFRVKRTIGADGDADALRTQSVVQIKAFVEYLRVFDLRGGDLSVRDL